MLNKIQNRLNEVNKLIEDISKVYLTALGEDDQSTEIRIDLARKKYIHFRNTI